MAHSRPARTSQGTDMMEYLRFSDAIEYEIIVKNCNRLAKPIGSRTTTNKCYILLWKATYFSSSVFIGTRHVLDTLATMREEPVPCLVMLAADCFIDAEMTEIVTICRIRVIPYIFIPTKKAMKDALSVDNDVLAVLIAFNHDPGMRREFEDCFVSITAQCFKKRKHRRERGPRASTSSSVPPEIGPRGEMPQQVSTEVSTVPSGEIVSLLDQPGNSDDWITVSTDSESSDSDKERPQPSKDFSVNVPDESGSTFHEYVRIPSPTPAPSPSEMAAQQRQEAPSSTVEDTSTACSSDESVRPGPSRDFLTPPMKRRQLSPHRQATWPISLPYAPREDFDDDKVRMYLQTICRKKKMRLRTKTSVPPSSTANTPPGTQGYMQYPVRPQPSTSRPCVGISPVPPQEPIDVDADDLSFRWTMEDLSSTTSNEMIDLTLNPLNDSGFVHEISSSDDDVMMMDESTSNIQNEGAAGDGNICPMELSSSSSSASTATTDVITGAETISSQSSVEPNQPVDPPMVLEESTETASTIPVLDISSPRTSSQGDMTPASARSSDTQTSSSSSGELINLCPSSSSLFEMSDTQSVASTAANSVSALFEDVQASTSMECDDAPSCPSASASSANVEAGPSGSQGDVPAVPANIGELGDAAAAPSVSRAGGVAESNLRLSLQHPSAFGDVGIGDGNLWPMHARRTPARIPHRVTGTGEGGPSPFMPNSMSFMFAPRVVYTSAAADDGRRIPGQPREEDLLDIPFPIDEYSPRGPDDESPRSPDEDENNPRRSHSMDVIPSDDDEESELSSDDESVDPPSPFEFTED